MVDHCVNPSHKPRKLLRLASLVSLVGQVLPGLQIVSAVFSLRSVSGAGFTQTAVRTKPRLKTDLMSTHPPAAKPMNTTSFCGSSLVTPTCQLTVEGHAFHVESRVRFWSMSSVVGPTASVVGPAMEWSRHSLATLPSLCFWAADGSAVE